MIKTLIIYSSKYGFTKSLAEDAALILGPAKCIPISQLNRQNENFDFFVLCAPVYLEKLEYSTLESISQNEWLKQKKVALVCTCLNVKEKERYLQPLNDILGSSLVYSEAIEESFNKERLIETILTIKRIKDQGARIIEENSLKYFIEDFINAHNTCSLSTGYGDRIRSTPIEYFYKDETFYILSEGGEKFANILLNQNVSLSIFDDYKNMAHLGGMQITGIAEIINVGSEEYISVLLEKKLKFENIMSLPIALNLIRIKIKKIEFLWSGFKEKGYDPKQILCI